MNRRKSQISSKKEEISDKPKELKSFTKEELAKYDGKNENDPIYISIKVRYFIDLLMYLSVLFDVILNRVKYMMFQKEDLFMVTDLHIMYLLEKKLQGNNISLFVNRL